MRRRVSREFIAGYLALIAIALVASNSGHRLASERTWTTSHPKHAVRSFLDHGEFVANSGQWDLRVAFQRATPNDNGILWALDDGRLVHQWPMSQGGSMPKDWIAIESPGHGRTARFAAVDHHSTNEYWVNMNSSRFARPISRGKSVEAKNVWPGIHMRLVSRSQGVERVYEVEPGAQVADIQMSWEGLSGWTQNKDGSLAADAGGRLLRLSAPVATQRINGQVISVPVKYRLSDKHLVGFETAKYDPRFALIIDPILQATYFGTRARDSTSSVAIHPTNGDVYIAGDGGSDTLPALRGGAQDRSAVNLSYVARLDPTLQRIKQVTFYSGVGEIVLRAMKIHPQTGEIYIAGGVGQTWDLVARGGGAYPDDLFGHVDSFVARIAPDLRTILQTTYVHGVGTLDFAIHPVTGDIYTSGSLDGSSTDIVRFNRDLTRLLGRRTMIGESNRYVRVWALAFSPANGDLYVAGSTNARELPGRTGGAYASMNSSAFETIFLSRFDAGLTQLVQSTYVSPEDAFGSLEKGTPLVIDPISGDVIVASQTRVAPPNINGFQTKFGGDADILLQRFSSDLRRQIAASFLGSSGPEFPNGLAFSRDFNELYVVGSTGSSDFPGVSNGALPNNAGGNTNLDAFISRVDPMLAVLHQSTYYSAFFNLEGLAIAVHPGNEQVYIAGRCGDTLQETNGGAIPLMRNGEPVVFPSDLFNSDGYVVRFDKTLAYTGILTPNDFGFVNHTGVAAGAIDVSAPARIDGNTQGIEISVVGGKYSIDGDAFTSVNGLVRRGSLIRLRHVAGSTGGSVVTTQVTVGGVQRSWSSTTATGSDTTPAPITFAPRASLPTGFRVGSNTAIVRGIDAPAAINVTNGEYSIDGAPTTSAPGTIFEGQVIQVYQTTSDSLAATKTTSLTIGTVTTEFLTTTDPIDTTPHVFQFLDQTDANLFDDIYSAPVNVDSTNAPAPISIVGGQYSVAGQPFRSDASTASPRDFIQVRVRTAGAGSRQSATLTIGGVSDTFTVTASPTVDDIPDNFQFINIVGAAPGDTVSTTPIYLTGLNTPITITPQGCAISVADQAFSSAAQTARAGDTLRPQLVASGTPGATVSCSIQIGGARTIWSVTTAVPPPPPTVRLTSTAAIATAGQSVTLSWTSTNATSCTLTGGIAGDGWFERRGDSGSLAVTSTTPQTVSYGVTCTNGTQTASAQVSVTYNAAPVQPPPSTGGGSSGGGGGGGGHIDWLTLVALLLSTSCCWRSRPAR